MYPLTDIWFIGDSLISHLSDRAAFRASSNLGLANKTVHWLGTSSMHWHDLILKFQLAMMFNPPPVMILVHVGGNDLVTMRQGKLIKNIKKDLHILPQSSPQLKLFGQTYSQENLGAGWNLHRET